MKPRPPFINWPVQVHDPRFGFVWYAHPAVFVTQLTVSHVTVETAELVNERLNDVLAYRLHEIRAHNGLAALHDWRSVQGYDKAARQYVMGAMKRRPSDYLRSSTIAFQTDNVLLRLVAEAMNLAAAVTLNAKLQMVASPDEMARKLKLLPPRPGEPFPG